MGLLEIGLPPKRPIPVARCVRSVLKVEEMFPMLEGYEQVVGYTVAAVVLQTI